MTPNTSSCVESPGRPAQDYAGEHARAQKTGPGTLQTQTCLRPCWLWALCSSSWARPAARRWRLGGAQSDLGAREAFFTCNLTSFQSEWTGSFRSSLTTSSCLLLLVAAPWEDQKSATNAKLWVPTDLDFPRKVANPIWSPGWGR